MPVDHPFASILCCPRCLRGALDTGGTQYRCASCAATFPLLDGIPWLFAEPEAMLGEWRARLHRLVLELQNEAQHVRRELERGDLKTLTRSRLKLLAQAYTDHARRLQALLAPLALDATLANLETHLALRTRLPASQDLVSYYVNMHRDWAWGEEENEASFRLIDELLKGGKPGRTLVLGAGACRLAYDVHMRASPELTVALDINPLPALAARRILAGEALALYEFPLAPRRLEDHAILRSLAAPKPVAAHFHLVLADALRAPFAADSFDTLITPWFIDILTVDFAELAPRVNGLLRPGGRWLNFGSLSFSHRDAALCYTREEVREILVDAGFTPGRELEKTLPYMHSPASRHSRVETVIAFSASKARTIARPSEHASLPRWLVDSTLPVPLVPQFQMTAVATRIYAFVMALIDGQRSADDIAQVLVMEKLMTADDAGPSVRAFLMRMHEDSRAQKSF